MRINISSKIIIAVSIIVVSVLLIGFYVIISEESDDLFNEMRRNANIVSRVIQESTSEYMGDVLDDMNHLQTLTEHLGSLEGVEWVEVFDRDATIIAHSQKERIGSKPLEIHQAFVHKIFETGKPIEEEDKQSGKYNKFVPVYGISTAEEKVIIGVVELVMDMESLSKKIAELRLQMMLIMVALIASILIAIFWCIRRVIVLPLYKLADITNKVTEGNFTERVNIASHDELGMLGTSFNKMSEQLVIITEELKCEVREREMILSALQESEEIFRTISTSAKDAIIMIDNESIISFWNKAAEEIFGYSRENAIGKALASLIIPEGLREAHMTGFAKFKDTGHGQVVGKTVRLTAIREDGAEFPISLSLSAVMIKDKWNAIGIVRDITERKLIEERLEESEDKFRSISDSANDAIIMLDNDEKISYWNKSAESIFGYSRDDVEGNNICELIIPERFREKHIEGFERFKSIGTGDVIGKTVEVAGIRKDGSEIPIELSLSSVKLKGKWCAIGLIRDITDRKKAEKRLKAQHAVAQILSVSNSLKEASSKILQAICESLNWEFGALWFYHRQDKVLRCSELWHIPGSELLKFKEKTREISFAPEIGLPGRVWASGKSAWIVDVVKDPNFPRAPVASEAGLHAAFGFPVIVNEEVLGTLEFFSHAKEEPDSDLLNMMSTIGSQIGLFIKRKQTEKELRESHKMMSVGRLTASVFHEVLNPINIISSHTQLLLMEAEKGSRTEEDLRSIQGEIDRIVKITDNLRTISSGEESEIVEVEINGLLENTLDLIRPELNIKSIKAVLKLEKELPEVMAHGGEIGQAFINIVSNAIEAMPDGGTLTIITQCEQKKGLPLVRIKIIDTGCGIAKNIMDKIFEPFFSTKKEIKGVGLGLSSSYNIINGCGGKLSVESEEGNGTTFIIDLPINI